MKGAKQFIIFFCLALASCTYDEGVVPTLDPLVDSRFPDSVGQIVINKCATSGCHNTTSAPGASGLDLTSWSTLFKGNRSGAVCIPFAAENSSMFMICNTFSDLGVQIKPTMPPNASPLTRNEVETLKSWINSGAPNVDGQIPFENLVTQKLYITNQGCDLVAVFDANKRVVTRYKKIGANAVNTEAPHYIRLSPDGKYWFVVLYAGNVFQKFDAITDTLVAQVQLPSFGGWSVTHLTADSKTAILADLIGGAIQMVNVDNMTLLGPYYNVFPNAHGLAIHPTNGKLYVTNQYSNYIYKMDMNDPVGTSEEISLASNGSIINGNSLNPHEIVFTPDGSKYLVTCDYSNEVRIMDASTDTLMAVIPVPNKPLEIFVSHKYPYAVLGCHDFISAQPASKGAVVVIDFNTFQTVKIFDAGFYEPHGIAINDAKEEVYVVSRNVSATGPAPHHASACGGRNGFVSIINLKSLTLLNFKHELSVDPYSAAFKN